MRSLTILPNTQPLTIKVLLVTASVSIVYILLVLLLGLMQKDELNRIPWIGPFLAKLAIFGQPHSSSKR